MADNTKIEWTDATWNPITGCSVVSAGCKHCYAMRLAGTRLRHVASRQGLTVDTKAGPVWTGEVRFNEAELLKPLSWRRPRMIFVCAHGDLFHEKVPDEWIDRVFAVMALAPQHTFQVLTKRAERMQDYMRDRKGMGNADICRAINDVPAKLGNRHGALKMPLPNVWLGVSVEDQETANQRIPILLDTPAALRWISAEPLLGPIDLHRIAPRDGKHYDAVLGIGRDTVTNYCEGYGPRIDWVVGGFESGPKARPGNFDEARSLRDQCAAAGTPFLWKQNGEHIEVDGPRTQPILRALKGDDCFFLTADRQQVPLRDGRTQGLTAWNLPIMKRVGKKAAGRLLDGVLHDGFPEVRS